jgi:hypothetical protein
MGAFNRRATATVVCALALVALAQIEGPTAQAATQSCGTEKTLSDGRVFMVRATSVSCATAKSVAGGWFNVQSQGSLPRVVFDSKQRRWACRVVEAATGTDPGFIPYTSVRCSRKTAVVRFKLRS